MWKPHFHLDTLTFPIFKCHWLGTRWYYNFCFDHQIKFIKTTRKRIVSKVPIVLPFCCFIFLPSAPDSFFYHFLCVWRTFFGQYLRVAPLATNSLSLPLRMSWFHSWRVDKPDLEWTLVRSPLPTLERGCATSSFHGFRWKSHCQSDWSSSVMFLRSMSLLSGCFQDFSLSLVFSSLTWYVLVWILGVFPVWILLSMLGIPKLPPPKV